MADRHRSQDGTRDTDKYLSDDETPNHQGRSDGNLQRQVGTKAALKRAEKGEDEITRVRKSDKISAGEDTRDD
ncbi:hypothetical protein [Nereida sp. MMG025]|uniref:hypothetical protein n=1 Tax=Nereida sp. MMG025 TaxID=2909981 RepID=UPI001F47482E|nr:hypothetical protein [Nereida sp. MMG025]MCF6445409.1 hypothetical protein [Nereida sp. MMG025]